MWGIFVSLKDKYTSDDTSNIACQMYINLKKIIFQLEIYYVLIINNSAGRVKLHCWTTLIHIVIS